MPSTITQKLVPHYIMLADGVATVRRSLGGKF
jgi:hypothetical protein